MTHLVADCSVEVEQELLEQDVAALCILPAFIVLQLTVKQDVSHCSWFRSRWTHCATELRWL